MPVQTFVLGLKAYWRRFITHFGLGSSKGEEPCRGVVTTGEGPCLLGSIVLGKYPLGNSTVALRDLADLPRGVACLPSPKPCQAPDCLRRCRVPSSGEEGELPWESPLSAGESVFFWGSL